MIRHLTTIGLAHAILALVCIVVGAIRAAWAVSAAATGLVMLVGAVVVRGHRPPAATHVMQTTAAGQKGWST